MASAFGWTALGRDSMLLPAMLKELGYRTAVVGKLHLNPKTCRHFQSGGRFGCGIDHQYGFLGGMSDYYQHHHTWSRDGVKLREEGYMTELLAAEAERVIHGHSSGAHANASLFLWLSLNAPHVPLQAPNEWIQRQRADLDPTVRTYAAMVGAMDDAFGRAARALRTAGMLRSSLIVFASDNGGPIIPAACNGGLRGGKGSPYDGGFRAPAFVFWPECLGSQRRISRIPAHMVDLFATLTVAASAAAPMATQQRVLAKLRKKAPHSVPLWRGLASTGGGGVPDPPELARRQLVLQVSASSSSVMRGRWKLVLASTRCLYHTPSGVSHEAKMAGFPADGWLLSEMAEEQSMLMGAGRNASARGHGTSGDGVRNARLALGSNRARLRAALAAGVEFQLYDLHSDPAETHDLLSSPNALKSAAASTYTRFHGSPGSGGTSATHRNETAIAAAMLGHYLAAVRVGRRNLLRAYDEQRVSRGAVMVVWFCRQVEFSWTQTKWEQAQQMMCRGRSVKERKQIGALPQHLTGAARAKTLGISPRA